MAARRPALFKKNPDGLPGPVQPPGQGWAAKDKGSQQRGWEASVHVDLREWVFSLPCAYACKVDEVLTNCAGR